LQLFQILAFSLSSILEKKGLYNSLLFTLLAHYRNIIEIRKRGMDSEYKYGA
jgi:hypothetical protein